MSKKDILKISGATESFKIEWKPSLSQINEIMETISAFANTEGGKIIVGVSNSGRLIGVEIGKGTIEQLTNRIGQEIDPKIRPHITVERVDNKNVIIVEVKQSHDKLVLASGKPYKRVGKSSVGMSKDEYEWLILEKHKHKLQFDKQVCKGAVLKDIDWRYVKEEFIPLYEKTSERKL